MTLRHAFTLTLAAAFLATGFVATADAATHRARARSHGTHMVSSHGRMHSRMAPAAGADHSADALNAQSLSRAQGATQ